MGDALSPNTKAILLLTAPLLAGQGKRGGRSGGKKTKDLLSPAEYRKLARRLRELECQPADLLAPEAGQLLDDCARVIERGRLARLLARGFLLSQAVEHWQARAIWVVSRADPEYPQRLKSRLGHDSPAVLYGCGEITALDGGGLAVVGSRHVDDALIESTERIGELAARAGRPLVSGGARGIDQAAMRGALEAGGRVTGVLADSLERQAMRREHRNMVLDGRLVLISPYDPNAGFNVGHAMQRNKLIYALADAALVVSAEVNKGGTWAGATEQLEKLRFVPVFVRSTGAPSEGLDALQKKGARPWPNPSDDEGLEAALSAPAPPSAESAQQEFSFDLLRRSGAEQPQEVAEAPAATLGDAAGPTEDGSLAAADTLLRTIRSLIPRILQEPKKPSEVADELGVTRRQAERWLQQLADEHLLEKSTKPVRYSLSHQVARGGEPSRDIRKGWQPEGSNR
jgi:predicted Rossmann fold nucleotide-binding protein DprA/Smf involved in DNA uptake